MITKFSEMDLEFAKQVLRIEPDFTEDDIEVGMFLEAAKDFVRIHSQYTDVELDASPLASLLVVKMLRADGFGSGKNEKTDVNTEKFLTMLRTYNIGKY